MRLTELITPDHVLADFKAADKARLLSALSARAGQALGTNGNDILQALQAREKLGSTGVGHGVALPHARIDGLKSLFGLFARLERAIDYQAIDEKPVDLVFLLLTPADASSQHLAALAAVSRRLRDGKVTDRLRSAKDAAALYALLTG